jgi:cytochrome c oxidase subunit I+III
MTVAQSPVPSRNDVPTTDIPRLTTVAHEDPAVLARLTALWETPKTLARWITTVDHKSLGIRYIITAFVFFAAGGVEAIIMRAQLARPDSHVVAPETYNQLFTMHGVTMMFLFVQPVLSGFSFYLTPLMLGARELAFPRLNSFSYYAFVFAGIFIYTGFLFGAAPDAGWFNYVPLSGASYSTGPNIDFYAIGLLFLGIATTAGAVNSIVSILKLRAPGMSIDRMPLFLWSSLTTSVSIVFAMPALSAALILLELERHWNFVFFDAHAGGNPMLWQHLFWVFGHPWVYIVFLPATGMLSMIIPVFSRRPMIGHTLTALSTVLTGVIGFGVWVHHMFATGLPQVSLSFFAAASMTVSIPSAILMAAWITTMWNGKVVFKTPMLFALAFIVQFVVGGISGVMTAAVPFDWQATDTYFIVAHLHYVMVGGTVFGVFAGIYFWFPKMFGRMLSERVGVASFWLMVVGFNLTFFPMHMSGLLGMPRRIYTYAVNDGVTLPNMLSTVGNYVMALGILVTLANILWSRKRGAVAGDDPWNGESLEWLATSPPAEFNFGFTPIVRSASPLWTHDTTAGPVYDAKRLTSTTSVLDATPMQPLYLPEGNMWPVVAAVALLVASGALLMRHDVLASIFGILTLLTIARWMRQS